MLLVEALYSPCFSLCLYQYCALTVLVLCRLHSTELMTPTLFLRGLCYSSSVLLRLSQGAPASSLDDPGARPLPSPLHPRQGPPLRGGSADGKTWGLSTSRQFDSEKGGKTLGIQNPGRGSVASQDWLSEILKFHVVALWLHTL